MRNFGSFKEIDVCGVCDGRINVASINVRKGVILLQKENRPMPGYQGRELAEGDYDFMSSVCLSMHILGQSKWRHRKGEQHKPKRENPKTMSDSKIQRASRALLRELKAFCFEDVDFESYCLI